MYTRDRTTDFHFSFSFFSRVMSGTSIQQWKRVNDISFPVAYVVHDSFQYFPTNRLNINGLEKVLYFFSDFEFARGNGIFFPPFYLVTRLRNKFRKQDYPLFINAQRTNYYYFYKANIYTLHCLVLIKLNDKLTATNIFFVPKTTLYISCRLFHINITHSSRGKMFFVHLIVPIVKFVIEARNACTRFYVKLKTQTLIRKRTYYPFPPFSEFTVSRNAGDTRRRGGPLRKENRGSRNGNRDRGRFMKAICGLARCNSFASLPRSRCFAP